MIGDGMGPGQLATASVFAHGEPGRLSMQALPVHGQLSTGSLSGITDSAAAATTMATGVNTLNGRIGTDADAVALTSVIELAKEHGLATGVVTTAYLPHATPGAFTAHRQTRHDALGIADDQALLVQPDVLLGGGAAYYLPAGPGSHRTDGGLIAPMEEAGYTVVTTAAALEAAANATRMVGLFSEEHMDYVLDRGPDTTQPTLRMMTLAALGILDADPDGFLLVVEGARIDMASHANDIERTIAETLAFDEAVEGVALWARDRDDVTVLVTADHECGGLVPDGPATAGAVPEVQWRWGQHTNARVDIFASGQGVQDFDGTVRDHRWVHAAMASRVTGERLSAPDRRPVPDGRMADLRHLAAQQTHPSSYGPGHNQLDNLWLDADPSGLAVGLEGVFKVGRNAVILLIDVDFGAASGFDG
jgi:alkaline phosphatase